jgi:hypothetical protein
MSITACSTIPGLPSQHHREHADEDALDDRVRQDHRRVGDPLEAMTRLITTPTGRR